MVKLHVRLSLVHRDQELAHHYAEKLEALGFEVERVSARGITFEGEKQMVESIFNTTIGELKDGYAFHSPPTLPDYLQEHVDSVYIPTQPSYFS
jgi:hypothetical protein